MTTKFLNIGKLHNTHSGSFCKFVGNYLGEISMACTTIHTDLGVGLCHNLRSVFHSCLVVGSEAMLLYDRDEKSVVISEIASQAISLALGRRSFVELLDDNKVQHLVSRSEGDIWGEFSNPYSCRISMNICIDVSSELYVNLQAVPVLLSESGLRFLMCSLKFSAKCEPNVMLLNQEQGLSLRYDFNSNSFVEHDSFGLSKACLEMLRLSRMGHSVDDIAGIMHRSRDTVKLYRKQAFEKLKVGSIEEAIAMCDLHHLI